MHFLRFRSGERCNPGRTRHTHRGHELLAVIEGRGRQLVGPDEVACVAGDIFVFPEGLPHMSCSEAGEGFTCLVLNGEAGDFPDGLSGDGGRGMLEAVAEALPQGGKLHVRPAARQQAIALLKRAMDEWTRPGIGSRCAARALAMEALVALARDVGRQPAARGDSGAAERHVGQAERWIADYWMTPVGIADLVALGPLGRSQLLARFRARTGRTVGQALLAIRLAQAQRLMRAGGMSLLDIALACGFGSQSHFNHRFRQATGRSPRAWLRRLPPGAAG